VAAWLSINGPTELVISVLTNFLLPAEQVMGIFMNETNCNDTAYISGCTIKPKQRAHN
jgi:hypothetical protein